MARIYIARTTGIGSFERHVVLKMILPERANDHTAVQMFLDEARLAASLNHQNVAQVFEVGEDGGVHFLAMEYVHGQDLRALLARAGSTGTRVPLELALTVAAGAAAGLNHAHERRSSDGTPMGIVHRDVSPSNIMIGYDGAVKLLDFGIAKATSRSVETQSGIIKGKFAYMAPEQCRGRDVDRRSDVFSLGIILYEVTTQHRCFRADSDFDTMHRIVTGDVVRPTRLVQGYPQALEAIVMKALAVDANQRYQSAGLLLEAIESFALAARMSLSTMALGRFMRETFGDIQEPWLVPGRIYPIQSNEHTISNTNASGDGEDGPPSEPMRHEDAPLHLPPGSVLDLPADQGRREPSREEWRAQAYAPPSQPSAPAMMADRQSAPSLPLLHQVPSPPVRPSGIPFGTQQIPPQHFAAHSGSGSGPAHGALPVGSQPIIRMPGFVAGPGGSPSELSYPRYEPPSEAVAYDVKPQQRLWSIAIGVVLIAIIVFLAVSIAQGRAPEAPPLTPTPNATVPGGDPPAVPSPSGAAASDAPGVPPKPDAVKPEAFHPGAEAEVPDAGVADSMSLRITSIPDGADVLLAGKPIGTTPLDTKLKRTIGFATLTVHRAKYEDFTTTIDLREDFTRAVTLVAMPVVTQEPQKARPSGGSSSAGREPRPAGREPRSPGSGPGSPREAHPDGESAHAHPAAMKCQPNDRVNPYDTSCGGQACPPCPIPSP